MAGALPAASATPSTAPPAYKPHGTVSRPSSAPKPSPRHERLRRLKKTRQRRLLNVGRLKKPRRTFKKSVCRGGRSVRLCSGNIRRERLSPFRIRHPRSAFCHRGSGISSLRRWPLRRGCPVSPPPVRCGRPQGPRGRPRSLPPNQTAGGRM
jgi:hypothetical protein